MHITCISNSLHLTLHTEINWWGHICYCLNKLYHESCKITAELYNYKKKKKKQLFRAVWGAFTCHVKTTQFSTLVYSLLSPQTPQESRTERNCIPGFGLLLFLLRNLFIFLNGYESDNEHDFKVNVNSVTDLIRARISSKECYHMLFNIICNVNCYMKYCLTVKRTKSCLATSWCIIFPKFVCYKNSSSFFFSIHSLQENLFI